MLIWRGMGLIVFMQIEIRDLVVDDEVVVGNLFIDKKIDKSLILDYTWSDSLFWEKNIHYEQ